jgi:hypothetical protein
MNFLMWRKLRGTEGMHENDLKAVTPECLIGGPVPISPGFPLKACGNDGLRLENLLKVALWLGG